MSKNPDQLEEGDIPETDFSGGVRGEYCERAMQGSNVVLLEPDEREGLPRFSCCEPALREYLSEHGAPPIIPKQEGG